MNLRRDDTDLALLVRYVAGECSKRERAEVDALITVDECKGRLLEEIKLLHAPPLRAGDGIDVDAAWKLLNERLQVKGNGHRSRVIPLRGSSSGDPARGPRKPSPCGSRRFRPGRRRSNVWHYAGIAAALAAVVITAVIASQRTMPVPEPEPEPEDRAYTTERGQRMLIRLADGTQVRLNVDSRLEIPADFAQHERKVHLAGEAYFDVVRDAANPFHITTNDAVVQVLGTSFNVRAYSRERDTQVLVADGRVAVRSEQMAAADTVVLSKGHMAVLSESGVRAMRRHVDVVRYLAWTEGRLVFVDAPIAEIANQLEVLYDLDIDIVVAGREHLATFNGVFEDEPLSEILKTVATTLGLRFEREERHITFYAASEGESNH